MQSMGLQVIKLLEESVLFQLQHGDLTILVTHLLSKEKNKTKLPWLHHIDTKTLDKQDVWTIQTKSILWKVKGEKWIQSRTFKISRESLNSETNIFFCSPHLRQYCVAPPEVAVCHRLRKRRDAAAGDIGLTHHRAQRAVHPLDKRPEEARPSLWRHRQAALCSLSSCGINELTIAT